MRKSLFEPLDIIQSRVITKRGDLDTLFEGFTRLRAITYVASPELLLEILDARGFTHMEIVVGDSLAPLRKESLTSTSIDVIDRLAALTESGTLRVLVPARTIHTKLYLLEGPSATRVIMSSANLTETARDASRQTNYAWFADLPRGHAWLDKVTRDYDTHTKRCTLFLDDLLTLIRQASDSPRRQVIEAWLSGIAPADPASDATSVLGDVTDWVLDPARSEEPVYSVRLPEALPQRRNAERVLTSVGGSLTGDSIRLDRSAFLSYAEQAVHLPFMSVDRERRELRIAMEGKLRVVTTPPPGGREVGSALDHLERYIQTVDWGEALDRTYAKMAMYEAMLYMLASPFANEHMRILRRRHGVLEPRGPKMLYLVGQSSNGKTTFLQFALFLITGRHIRPLPATELTKTKVQQATALRTCFPLVFDDVNPTQRTGFEDILKSHWETWWTDGGVSPQLVISSNYPTMREWAKSRLKRIDFDVHFAPSEHNTARLADLFREPSPLFGWFASIYLEQLARLEEPRDDELFLARDVMRELYASAGREVPAFFPERPLEEVYDAGRMRWLDLFERSRQATRKRDRERTIIEFADDLQHHEIKRYLALLPQTVKTEKGMPATVRRRWTRAEVEALIDANPLQTPRYELIDGELLVTASPGSPHQAARVETNPRPSLRRPVADENFRG